MRHMEVAGILRIVYLSESSMCETKRSGGMFVWNGVKGVRSGLLVGVKVYVKEDVGLLMKDECY